MCVVRSLARFKTKNSLSLIQLLQMNPVFSFSPPRAIGVKCRSKVCSHEFGCTRLRLKILDVMCELEDSFINVFLRVHVPKDQSQWKLDDSDLDETWSAGSAGPKTSVECHFWDIRTRTVGLGGSEGPKYDFFLERFFGKNFFLPIAGK